MNSVRSEMNNFEVLKVRLTLVGRGVVITSMRDEFSSIIFANLKEKIEKF